MLREMLNRHPALWITRETHYFDDLRPRLGDRAILPVGDADRERCERYFLALGHRAYGLDVDPAQSAVGVDQLRAEAVRRGGSADAYFEAFCVTRARAQGKERWGEKTPRHVFRIDELRSVFPQARVICLVRDPRGVAASYRDWKRGEIDREATDAAERERVQRSYHPVLHALLWRSTMAATLAAAKRHGSHAVRVLRYEDVVREPEQTVRSLTAWLGLDYDPGMLDVPIVQSSYRIPQPGVSTEPVSRWQHRLPAAEIAVIQACCRSAMRELGYEPAEAKASFGTIARTWLSTPLAFTRATSANRKRIGRLPEYLARRLGLPGRRSKSTAG
jgi:hypothetical protein